MLTSVYMFDNVSSRVDFVVFCRIHNEMSLSKSLKPASVFIFANKSVIPKKKSQRENYHLDRKIKVDVIQAIDEIKPKPHNQMQTA